jgi:hypothetical protein
VATTLEEARDMLEKRRANGFEKPVDDDGKFVDVTPKWIEKELADPQLAKALGALEAKIKMTSGPRLARVMPRCLATWPTAPRSNGNATRYQERLDEIHKELARIKKIIAGAEEDKPAEPDEQAKADEPKPEPAAAE